MAQIAADHSYWMRTATLPSFPPLNGNLTVDVAVVGGGLVGITTAHLLRTAGLTVALVERDRCASVDTGHTTAHLTFVTDTPLSDLVRTFGRDTALAVWDGGRLAIDQIESNVASELIDCEFRRVPGILHAALEGEGMTADELRELAELATGLGFPASFAPSTEPFGLPGVRFPHQAMFHPRKYVAGLLAQLDEEEAHIFEHSNVDEITEQGVVKAHGHEIRANYVVIATHTPLMGKSGLLSATMLQSKLAPYTTYALGGRLPRGSVPFGLYWDTASPYHYLRVSPGEGADYAIFGGADHKTGQQADTRQCWAALETTVRQFLPGFDITDRWSGQVIETIDGLPYIGETADRQFIATGFVGNGITFGTLAAIMARDAVLGRVNPWKEIFDPRRISVRAGAWDYLKENKDYAYYMVRDRLIAGHKTSLRSVRPGQGQVLALDGKRVAAYRDPKGVVSLCSAICTHMGCDVQFNNAETSWDCPCHGSRFRVDGSVIAGPAEKPLGKVTE